MLNPVFQMLMTYGKKTQIMMKLGSSIIIQGHNSLPNFHNILLGSL